MVILRIKYVYTNIQLISNSFFQYSIFQNARKGK